MDCSRNYVDRKFGHSVIKWKIRNYCLSPRDLDWTIRSPDFYIRMVESTKWRMTLKRSMITDEEYKTSFELTRLECNRQSQYAKADCKLYYCDRFQKHIIEEFEHRFAANSTYETELKNIIYNLAPNLAPINNVHSNVLILKLKILVQFDGVEEIFSTCSDLGIKKLSEDLNVLYENKEHYDMHFNVGNEYFAVHKAILYHRVRSSNLKEWIPDDDIIVILKHENLAVWDNVIRFLYTANMEYVLQNPAINTYVSAKYFVIESLIAYYAPDKLILYSTTEVEEFNFTWTIQNFSTRSERYLLSPIVTGTMGASFRFKIYPKGFGKKQEFMGVFVEVDGGKANEVCVQLSLKNAEKEVEFKRIHKRIVGREVFGDKNLVKLEMLEEYLENESLTISFRVRIPTGEQNNSNGTSITICKPYSEQLNYVQLSEDMLSLYRSSNFTDCQIFLEENSEIDVHKCILSARCQSLLDMLVEGNQNDIYSFKCSTIRNLLHFLYCGKLDDHVPTTDFSELFPCAEAFNVSTLLDALLINLQKDLTVMNVAAVADSENIKS